MAKNEKVSAGRPDVANTPRQSAVAFADYVNTLAEHAPEQLEDLVDPSTIQAVSAAIAEAGEHFESSTDRAIERAIQTKVDAAVKALTNDAPLTGYAGYVFDAEVFAAKTAPKKGRARLTPSEKAERVVEQATPEQLEALAALLKEKGISLD